MLRNLATYCAIALVNADAYRQLNNLLEELKATQDKLVTQSKLAALGTLTAGIAHEIKNPLNFINNFSGLNAELVEELYENVQKEKVNLSAGTMAEVEEIISNIKQNAIRIQEHGRRADSIVRSMLQHSRGGSGDRQPTDINNLLEEALNLTYHGMRAQDIGFNIKLEKFFDTTIGKMEIVPQEISRAFLNIISNGCYEAHRKKTETAGNFSPLLSVKTVKTGNQVKIAIRDNGNGIPGQVREKLFTPFFTTKPAGQGTGLGLSIAWDIIVQQHNGRISFESKEGEESFTEFTIILPYN
jgi:signal transduction histidine kinase